MSFINSISVGMKSALHAKSVGTLVIGAIATNAIALLVMPLLTRLYTPHDFSVLATFTAISSILGVIACLRYEIAIPLEKDDTRSAHLVVVCVLVSSVLAVGLFFFFQAFEERVAKALNQEDLGRYLWLVPIAVLLFAWITVAQMWMLREKEFKRISVNRVVQAAFAAVVQAGGGVLRVGMFPLIAGQIIKNSFGVVLIGGHVAKSIRRAGITSQGLKAAAREHQRLPRYSVLEALCNTAAMQAPLLMVAKASASPEAGYLSLAMTFMQAPMSLIGSAMGQGFLSSAGENARAGTLGLLVERSLTNLLRTGVGPLLVAGVAAPMVFPVVFGEGWLRAGILVAWMTPWFVLQFLSAPISMALYASGHERLVTAVHGFGLIVRLGLVALASIDFPAYVSEVYCVGGALHYGVFLVVILRCSGLGLEDLGHALEKALATLAAWLAVAAIIPLAWWYWGSRG